MSTQFDKMITQFEILDIDITRFKSLGAKFDDLNQDLSNKITTIYAISVGIIVSVTGYNQYYSGIENKAKLEDRVNASILAAKKEQEKFDIKQEQQDRLLHCDRRAPPIERRYN
jgi:hypothetical protein